MSAIPTRADQPWRTQLGRSVYLFRQFLVEQSDPHRFYSALAADSIAQVQEHAQLTGATVADLGAGPQEFAQAFRAAGARYLPLDYDPRVASVQEHGLVADAAALPLAPGSMDVVFSSNLWEHVREPERVADEMVRVTAPGGLIYLSYTNWLSPWGGHETSPWHWLGGQRAIRRYQRVNGRLPKNRVDETLFRVSVAQGLRWARARSDVDVLYAGPRYLPSWARGIIVVPLLRELLTWNLLIILRKRERG